MKVSKESIRKKIKDGNDIWIAKAVLRLYESPALSKVTKQMRLRHWVDWINRGANDESGLKIRLLPEEHKQLAKAFILSEESHLDILYDFVWRKVTGWNP